VTTVGPSPGTAASRGAGPPDPPRDLRGPRYYRMLRRRRGWAAVVLWSFWAVVGVALSAFTAFVLFVDRSIDAASPDTPEFRAAVAATDPALPGEPINVLLLGSDKRPDEGDPGRSDSLILVRMDPDRDFISLLSFPRDLRVEIPGVGIDKINAAYSYGGPKLALETIKRLTGQPINEFVNIDFQGFVRLVDAVGGVYLDVDRRYFNDNSGPGPSYDMIDLQPGYQRLDGNDALDYARYRHTDSDFARIARQQQFLSEVKRQTKQFGSLLRLPSFGRIFRDNIQMSIRSRRRLLEILELALTVDKARIARYRVQGVETMRNGVSYVEASPGEIAQVVDSWRNPEFLESAPAKRIDPASVRVVVLNGNGRVLAAEAAAAALAGKGFAARSGGNADSFSHATSSVLYAPGKREEARAVQRLLGPSAEIGPDEAPTRGVDVTVVVGADFTGRLYTPKPPPPVTAETVWTDALVPLLRRAQASSGGKIAAVVPLRVPPGSRLRIARLYRVNSGGRGPWALKLVFEIGATRKYWSMMQTEWENPPILDGETGSIHRGGRTYLTFYDGRNMMRVGWKERGMAYWISNSLDYALNSETMHAVARSSVPVARARLPRGVVSTPMEIETEGATP